MLCCACSSACPSPFTSEDMLQQRGAGPTRGARSGGGKARQGRRLKRLNGLQKHSFRHSQTLSRRTKAGMSERLLVPRATTFFAAQRPPPFTSTTTSLDSQLIGLSPASLTQDEVCLPLSLMLNILSSSHSPLTHSPAHTEHTELISLPTHSPS